MEHSIAADVEMDIDSLLLSHGGETDSDEEDRHRRTVDEILLNHSSPSPSPPSSPLNGDGDDDDNDVSANLRDHGLSHSHSVPLVDSHNYRYNSAANSSRANFAGRVLPPLFGNGAVRSNAKPGAALAAAAAASRSIPTPHATAIKLRRANTGVPSLQSSLSETSALSAAPSEVDLSQSQEEEGVHLPLENIHSDSTDVGDGCSDHGEYPPEDRHRHKSDEDSILETCYEDEECTMLNSKPHHASNIQSEEDQIPVIEQVSSPLAGEKNEQCAEIRAADESGDMVLPCPASSGVGYNEDIIGGEEGINSENTVAESEDFDYSNEHSAAAELLEDLASQGEGEDNSTKLQQKTDSSVKPLDLAEEIEKKQAFTGLHYEEGAAAQPMKLEGVKRGSTVLGYFDVRSDNVVTRIISSQAFRKDHGSPQVISVHLNYIAVGMSKGSIFVVPSKYTAHHVDNMDTKMTPLGLQGDRSLVPVTSMCFNQQGDILFAGYGDGHYTVWDVQKASALKVITEHRAPVVHMLYLGQDTQVTRQFNVVSGDSKGVVKLIRFTVVPWLNRISYTKPMKLLDETTSRVVCASPLLYNEGYGAAMLSTQGSSAVSTSSISSMMGGMVDEGVVIFITHQSALVAKVIPTVEVYAQIPKPDGIREGSMPYAAWRCGSQSLSSSSENALVEASDKASLLAIAWDHKVQVAKLLKSELKVLEKWTLESEAVGLAWLGDQMLAILTSTAQLCLYAKDGNLIHQTSFSVDGFRGDNLISHHIYYTNSSGNPEKAYHNSISVRGATMYILGQEHLIVSRLLSWKERIEVLRKAGDWIGALNMAMALYDGQSYGLVDLPKNLDDLQRTVMPYLAELLQAYVSEVFSYLSVACYNQNTKEDQSNEIKEQFIRVGGVAVEFCVHIRRTDILFDDIMSKFDEAHQKETFLELLEPYILKDMLGSLPPGIMQALVEHYSKRGWLQRIEQCVLHMDILSLDFNQVVRLCREHRLDCALIYLFNKGLDDFRTPLEELLLVLRDSTRENATSLGYRVLVYLKYCFQGLAFPPGHGNLSPQRVTSLTKELLDFLLEDSSAPNSWAVTSLSSNGAYANMVHLLQLDTEATLQVLKLAFVDVELSPSGQPSEAATDINMESDDSDKLVQRVVDILAGILDAGYFMSDSPVCSTETNSVEVWPSKEDVSHMYDFIAYYVAYGKATVSKDILSQIIQYLTSEVNILDTLSEKTTDIFRRREKQLLSLIQVVPATQWDAPYLLHLSEKAQFHKVCGYIHAISHQLVAAMDSYIKAIQEPVYAFSFIYEMLRLLDDEESDAFESAVISRIPDLVKLSREAIYFLITDHFSGRTPYILSDLRSHPESLFLYLKTVIEVQTTGTLDISCLQDVDTFNYPSPTNSKLQSNGVQAYLEAISTSLKLLHNNRVNVTDEMMETYFELLCRFDRKSVLKFLETSESYRVEHCLSLCQEHGITDAASFLLERVGEVGSALLLILSHLSEKFVMLDEEIQKAFSVDNLNALLKKKVVAEILDIVQACIGLCQRNSPRLQPEESESLWFQLLDSFCEPLMDSGNAREVLKDSPTGSVSPEEEAQTLKWKVSKYGKCARMTRKLFSIFIKEIVEGMIGYVRLPRIMLKLLSENGNQEFGDFKLTILGILGKYDFERRILDTAKSLIEDDTYYTMSLLMKGASHGYAPRSLVCCICGSLLAKNSLDSNIQVYSCGRKARSSSGMYKLAENGLVSSSPSSVQQPRSTPLLHLHDHEFGDNSFGSRPSRFELLHSLEGDQKLIQMENTPQLKLAPPALYHEKVKKGIDNSSGGSTSRVSTTEKPNSKQLRDVKLKGSSSVRFPLKSNIIFGKEKIRKR
ncbi:vacuolar protein sorting-associated protein 8 [Salvia divinorum]|uniref:Vacuolar protein sorting-associated protein 8 n=1 Tax=Salvia divinorum TaxID=28513 RepID=A0ABD1FVE1_SALDI